MEYFANSLSTRTSQSSTWPRRVLVVTALLSILAAGPQQAVAQEMPTVVRELQVQGTFESLIGDRLALVDADGKRHEMIIQVNRLKPIALTGGDVALNEPALIRVVGNVATPLLKEGMVVRATLPISTAAKTGNLQSLQILDSEATVSGIEFSTPPQGNAMVESTVIGHVKAVNSKRLTLSIPRHANVPKESLAISLEKFTETKIETRRLALVQQGDVIKRVAAVELSNGDIVVRLIDIELTGPRDNLRLTVDQQLQIKHWEKSGIAGDPRDFRSQHFLLRTDTSDRHANILLDKLEVMFEGVADYFGRQPRSLVQCYVVDDIGKWDTREWDARVVKKVKAGEGVTIYARRGNDQKAVVFAANNDDVVQHEAVHGFCFLTFDGTGPLWYAEGMAELGKYWQADSTAVAADPAVIGYLTSREPRPLKEIINADSIEGEVWRAYAWRWTLCHFLTHNPNYSREFKRLGIPIMRDPKKNTFENTFGGKAKELTFEYQQFIKHLQDGYRADLCAWQWNVKPRKMRGKRPVSKKILAARGWQATGIEVSVEQTYQVQATGMWKLADGELAKCNADGQVDGTGRLVAVVMSDFELSDEFDLGSDTQFKVPKDGQLFVRCREPMSLIANNQGELQVNFSLAE